MGVLKCHHQDPAGVRMRGLLERVEALLASDTDPQVVANCLYVMQQVQSAVEMVVQSGSCIIKRARSVVGALMGRGIERESLLAACTLVVAWHGSLISSSRSARRHGRNGASGGLCY